MHLEAHTCSFSTYPVPVSKPMLPQLWAPFSETNPTATTHPGPLSTSQVAAQNLPLQTAQPAPLALPWQTHSWAWGWDPQHDSRGRCQAGSPGAGHTGIVLQRPRSLS